MLAMRYPEVCAMILREIPTVTGAADNSQRSQKIKPTRNNENSFLHDRIGDDRRVHYYENA